MRLSIPKIPMRDVLHYLGWRGEPVEEALLVRIQEIIDEVQREASAYAITRSFELNTDKRPEETVFVPQGRDIHAMLEDCDRLILMAATLGAQSERMLLRRQARSSAEAFMMDAVLSAAIEAVCDELERNLRMEYRHDSLHVRDRFSPGYGDMPLEQTAEICSVLQTEKTIGLTVSHSGIMIPRKSVTAILGVSRVQRPRRPSRCAGCSMRETCALRERE